MKTNIKELFQELNFIEILQQLISKKLNIRIIERRYEQQPDESRVYEVHEDAVAVFALTRELDELIMALEIDEENIDELFLDELNSASSSLAAMKHSYFTHHHPGLNIQFTPLSDTEYAVTEYSDTDMEIKYQEGELETQIVFDTQYAYPEDKGLVPDTSLFLEASDTKH